MITRLKLFFFFFFWIWRSLPAIFWSNTNDNSEIAKPWEITKYKKNVLDKTESICKRDLLWNFFFFWKETKEVIDVLLPLPADRDGPLTVFQPFLNAYLSSTPPTLENLIYRQIKRNFCICKLLFFSHTKKINIWFFFFFDRWNYFSGFFFSWLTLELFNSPLFFWPCPSGLTPPFFSSFLLICTHGVSQQPCNVFRERRMKRNR